MTPASMSSGGSGVALPLAQMVSGIIDSANYDPATDINRQNALKINEGLRRQKEQDTIRAQSANLMNDPYVPLADIAANLSRVGIEPEEVGKSLLLANATRGRGDQDMDTALSEAALLEVAAGTPSGSVFNASTYGARKKPTEVMQNGVATLVPADESYGQTPVLEKSKVEGNMLGNLAGDLSGIEQRRVVGAAPLSETVMNYMGPDGQRGSAPVSQLPTGPGYTAFAGQATGTPDQLRPTVRAQLQTQGIANEQFGNMMNMAEDIARRDPTIFGATGNVRRLAQNVGQQVGNIRQLAPEASLGEVFADTQQRAAANGINLLNPMQYDPNLTDIVTMSELLIFGAAEALANQQGRSVSDKDVGLFRSIVGDPTGWTSSQEQFLSKMGLIRNVLNMKQGVIQDALNLGQGGLGGVAASAASPSAAPPAPAAPMAPEAELPPGATMVGPGRAQLPDSTILKWVP